MFNELAKVLKKMVIRREERCSLTGSPDEISVKLQTVNYEEGLPFPSIASSSVCGIVSLKSLFWPVPFASL